MPVARDDTESDLIAIRDLLPGLGATHGGTVIDHAMSRRRMELREPRKVFRVFDSRI